jgi:glycosyltransferase involved in cell wall biosynthesis
VEGVCWFAREVLPGLQRQVPEARFVVVGRDPAPAVRRLARRGVVVTGAVPDVRPYLEAAAAGVCPLLLARGIQNKVLEAMASQRPVVASPAALEGIDAVEGEEILRAERPEEWIEALTELLQDPAAASRLAERGRRRVEADYTWQARMQTLLRICREALACGEDGSGAATGETPERTASADTA